MTAIPNTWRKHVDGYGIATYYSDRPDGTEMNVKVNRDGTHEILVYQPSTDTEYLDGDIPDRTVNECIERAESVVLPDEDTGI